MANYKGKATKSTPVDTYNESTEYTFDAFYTGNGGTLVYLLIDDLQLRSEWRTASALQAGQDKAWAIAKIHPSSTLTGFIGFETRPR
jgi:hypothetical protein